MCSSAAAPRAASASRPPSGPSGPETLPQRAPAPFPKRYRVRKSADYRRIQGRGRRHRATHLLALALPAADSEPRVGLTVSKKVGNAVARNRVKRWLREAVRHERHRLSRGARTWDVVLIAHSSAAEAGLEALQHDVARLFERASAPPPTNRTGRRRKRERSNPPRQR